MDEDYFPDEIRQHISVLPHDMIFTTREMLVYASRSIVDKTLFRLVRAGHIQRLARGVFVREITDKVTPLAIATAKLKAFGKKIFPHQGSVDAELLGKKEDAEPLKYRTDGRSSSFKTIFGRVQTFHAAPRQIELIGKKHGEIISYVWSKVRQGIGYSWAYSQIRTITNEDRTDLRCNIRWMPHWMGDIHVHRPLPKVIREQLKQLNIEDRQRRLQGLDSTLFSCHSL